MVTPLVVSHAIPVIIVFRKMTLEINKKHFKKVKLAKDIVNADSVIVLTHIKGHEMGGYGGAIKNLAMQSIR